MRSMMRYILISGIICLSAGVVIYIISSSLWAYALVPGFVGLVLLSYYFYENRSKVKDFFIQPATIYRGNIFLLIVVVLLIMAFLNAIFYRHHLRWDLTQEKIYSLSQSTVQELEHLKNLIAERKEKGDKDPFEIILFVDLNSPQKSTAEELMEQYKYHFRDLKYRIVDPDRDPALASEYKVKSYGVVIVRFGNKTIQVREINENDITNGIIKVTRGSEVPICFVIGHGEMDPSSLEGEKRSISSAKRNLESVGYEVKSVSLAKFEKKEDLQKECQILVIAGPMTLFLPQEINVFKDFMEAGGKALLLLDPGVTTGLEEVLKSYGVEVDNSYVVDFNAISQVIGSGPIVPLGVQYDRFHAISKDFRFMTIFPVARSLKKLSPPSGFTVTEIVKTGKESWAEFSFVEEIQKTGKVKFDPGKDREGPITLAMAIEGSKNGNLPEGSEPPKMRIVVVGDSDFITDNYFSAEVEGKESVQPNGDFFLNCINWLGEQKDLISIRPKEKTASKIILTATAGRLILVLTLFVLPLSIALAGFVIWISKRYM